MRAAFGLRLRADYRQVFTIRREHPREALSHATGFLAAIRKEIQA